MEPKLASIVLKTRCTHSASAVTQYLPELYLRDSAWPAGSGPAVLQRSAQCKHFVGPFCVRSKVAASAGDQRCYFGVRLEPPVVMAMPNDWITVLFCAIAYSMILTQLVLMVLFWRRRHLPDIASRDASVVVTRLRVTNLISSCS